MIEDAIQYTTALLESAEFDLVDIAYTTIYVNTVKPRFFKGYACNGHHSPVSTWRGCCKKKRPKKTTRFF